MDVHCLSFEEVVLELSSAFTVGDWSDPRNQNLFNPSWSLCRSNQWRDSSPSIGFFRSCWHSWALGWRAISGGLSTRVYPQTIIVFRCRPMLSSKQGLSSLHLRNYHIPPPILVEPVVELVLKLFMARAFSFHICILFLYFYRRNMSPNSFQHLCFDQETIFIESTHILLFLLLQHLLPDPYQVKILDLFLLSWSIDGDPSLQSRLVLWRSSSLNWRSRSHITHWAYHHLKNRIILDKSRCLVLEIFRPQEVVSRLWFLRWQVSSGDGDIVRMTLSVRC